MQFRDDWLAQRGFSWTAGYALASACKLSYENTAETSRVLGQVWRVQGRVFRSGRTEALLAMGPRAAVIAFRGTQGLSDWMSNLQVPPARSAAFGAEVHSGFLAAYASVAHLVDRAVAEAGGRRLWFTGHSLGGAIAVVAAAHHRARNPAGVVTFGQPRMLSRGAAAFMHGKFGGRYVRLVNDDDIVARIPGIYHHAGRLLHFNFAGALEAEATLGATEGPALDEAASDGPAPASPAEEAAIERTARAVEAAAGGGQGGGQGSGAEFEGLEGGSDTGADVAIEGLVPGVPAHRIEAYVQLMRVRALAAEAEDETFDDDARDLLRHREDDTEGGLESSFEPEPSGAEETAAEAGHRGSAGVPSPARQPVLLRLRSVLWEPPAGMPVPTRFGQFATALASAADIDALRTDPAVTAIEVSRDAGIEELDSSVPFVGAADIHRPPLDERGDGAILGLIDTGVDILHHAFRRPDGTTRLLAIWDQRGSGGLPPSGQDAAFTQGHGRLYLAAELDAMIAAHEAGTGEVPMRLRDLAGHGTHVAGIAVGRAVGEMAEGMAPEAPILCVIAGITQGPGEPPSIGYSMSHVDALAFLRRVAQGGTAVLDPPMPIAINVSLGMNAGAHDGSTTLEAAFDAITGGGRDPDCVIVKSAGNERGHAGHARVAVATGLLAEVTWTSAPRPRAADYFEAWFDGLDDVAFRLKSAATGAQTGYVSFDAPVAEQVLAGNLCRLHLKKMHPDNGAHRLVIAITPSPEPIRSGRWTLEMHGRDMVSPAGAVHVWVERTQERAIRFDTEDPEMTLSVPGTARTVIAVGACNSEIPARLNDSSSWGLTRDGRRKPELCAPGFQVRSAMAGGAGHDETVPKSGTSMAAPHVAGAIALVMSRRRKLGLPALNAVQYQTALIRTVRGSPMQHHVGAGYGVLDAGALFDELTKPDPAIRSERQSEMTDPMADPTTGPDAETLSAALAFVESVDLPGAPRGLEATVTGDLPPPDFESPEGLSVAVGSQIASFAAEVPPKLRAFIADAFLLAQLAANKAIEGGGTGEDWYATYVATLGRLGWTAESADRSMRNVGGGSAEVHREIISVVTLLLGPGAAAAAGVTAVLNGLANMERDAPWITLFQRRSQRANANQFQISTAAIEAGKPVVRLVGFELDAERSVTQVLFFRFGQADATLRQFSQTMSVNERLFEQVGPRVAEKLGHHVAEDIAGIEI